MPIILILDDDQDFLDVLKSYFLSRGFEVITASYTDDIFILITYKMSTNLSIHADFIMMLSKMDGQLNKLLGLITNMLKSTHIKAGELNYHFALFDLTNCVRDCVEGLKTANPQHQFKCEFIDDETILIEGGKDRIGQVIINFLTNAIKYSPGKFEVQIACKNRLVKLK